MKRFETLDIEQDDGILLVAVNRPHARNALDAQTMDELRAVLTITANDDDVAGLIFGGAREKTFVSGADIAELRTRTRADGIQGRMQRLFTDLEAYEKPTVAAIGGHALGGGCEFALACDLRIAAKATRFGFPEVGLGIIPGAGGTQRLARHVGLGRAVELILTGRLLAAEEAQRIGLITEVVEHTEVVPRAKAMLRGILSKAPLAITLAKMVTRASLDTDERTGLMIERLAQAILYTTDDKNEGIDAFLEHRTANFTGK
jgi:enoyl-CoA hydratase/carnithine racemase